MMVEINGLSLSILDIVAFLCFFACWGGYSFVFDAVNDGKNNLVGVMHRYRLQWMKQVVRRQDRVVDIRIIGNFIQSSAFLASTSILIIAGLVAMMGYGKEALVIMGEIAFVQQYSLHTWILKTMLLFFIFIYSFFKFTWTIRQLNYVSVLILSAPTYREGDDLDALKKETKYVSKCAVMLSNIARHFNAGVRSYYFGLVALSWYVHPVLLIVLSLTLVMIIYRREFMSKTLVLLS